MMHGMCMAFLEFVVRRALQPAVVRGGGGKVRIRDSARSRDAKLSRALQPGVDAHRRPHRNECKE